MAKNVRKMLAMVLVMCMLVSALPMQALAAEGDEVFTNTETKHEGGLTTSTTTTITTTTTDEAKTVVVETKEETSGTTTNGVTVTGTETTTETTTFNANGTITEKTIVDGAETKEWTEKDFGNNPNQPKVEVDLIPGKTTTGTATNTEYEGSINHGNGQTTTTTIDRTVNATTTDETVVVTKTTTSLDALQPELKFDRNDKADQAAQKKVTELYTDNGHFHNPSDFTVTDAPEDYPFQYVGTADYSGHYASKVYVVYERDEAGNALKDENGEYIIKELQHSNGTVLTKNGVPTTDLEGPYDQTTGTRPTMFMLKNEDGDAAYAYCIDLGTPTSDKKFYQIANLEDNDYYATEDATNHVRNIVFNGYWGTADGTGSIEKVREDLKTAVANGDVEKEYDITFVIRGQKYTEGYELQEGEYVGNGYVCKQVTEHVVLTDEVIDSLTEGEAMDATQTAIWSYANGSKLTLDGTDRMIVGDITYASCALGDTLNKENDFAGAARTKALYTYLVNLNAPMTSTTVINDKNNVENMQLVIGAKVANHMNNGDRNTDNDVYHAEMKFSLAFDPNYAEDDLLVYLTDGNGNTVKDASGNDIVRHLTGEKMDIEPDDNGVYTLTGLQLTENEDQTFGLRLAGSQELALGAYIYTAEGGIGKSQTMVGVAQGTNTVDVTRTMTFNFDVEEDNHVTQKRVWHREHDPVITPPPSTEPNEPTNPITPPGEPNEPAEPAAWTAPENQRLANEEGVEIPEEPVPLASPVITGDDTGLWIMALLLIACGMVAVNVFDKKRHHETF